MNKSLEKFCSDTREILANNDNHEGREAVRQRLEQLLIDPDFCAEYVSSGSETGVEQIYQDDDLGFCVLAYNMDQPRTSPPHDHGKSWAVYGQTHGYTDMTIWAAPGDDEGTIEPVDTFRLGSGQAGLFDVREIHSIEYTSGAKFVRVTGVDMSAESRRVYNPDEGTFREIENVGAGSNRG